MRIGSLVTPNGEHVELCPDSNLLVDGGYWFGNHQVGIVVERCLNLTYSIQLVRVLCQNGSIGWVGEKFLREVP